MEEVGISQIIDKTKSTMAQILEKLQRDLSTIRTGRASPQLIENIKVEHYGSLMPIKQLGGISVPDARTIEITPWDKTALEPIEKTLQQADLGTSPLNDGNLIRITLPQMTEEGRKNLAKKIKSLTEDFKVKVRNERRNGIEKIKKSLKLKEITEDDCKRFESEVQKITDGFISKIETAFIEKEKEIMSV